MPKAKTEKAAASAIPETGKSAPAFTLKDTDGATVKLSQFKGKKNVVLYFYPKDNTPGCTKEACAFQKDLAKFAKSDTVVLGVSPDDAKSHGKFRDKFGLAFPLLVDTDTKVAQKYGVWVEKNLYGRRYMGVQRATFLIDKQGKLAAVWPKVKVEGHSGEILKALKDL
jgi:peroxiredoxin Q/BCP